MTEKPRIKNTRDNMLLLWIFLSAFFLRMIYIFQLQKYPFFDYPLLDFTFFDQRAREILAGQLFSGDYYFNPLYSYYLALVYKFIGYDLYFPRLIQAFLGASSTILIYNLGKSMWNRSVGLIAAIMAALYIPLVYYDGILMATTLIIFLTLSALNLLNSSGRTGSGWKHFIAGLLMGLAVLGRPNLLLVAVFLAVWFLWKSHPPWKAAGNYVLFVLGIIAIISHISIHHKRVNDEWVLVAPHGGINFYIGNHPEATGAYMSIPGISDAPGQQVKDSIIMAEKDMGRPVSAAEVSQYWMGKSRKFMRNDPAAFTRLSLRKIALFFNYAEIPSEYGLDFDSQYLSILRWPLFTFAIIGPLAILGVITGFRRRQDLLMLYLVLTAVVLSIVLFFVHARYRLQGIPYLILFAAGAVYWIWEKYRSSQWKLLIPGFLVLLAAAGFTRMDLVQQNFLPGHYNLARSCYRAGDPDGAIEQLNIILQNSESAKTREFLGKIYLETKRYDQAITQLNLALQLDPSMYEAVMDLGVCYFHIGRYGDSKKAFQKAATLDGARYEAPFNLGMVALQQLNYAEARTCFQQTLDTNVSGEIRNQVNSILHQLDQDLNPQTEPVK